MAFRTGNQFPDKWGLEPAQPWEMMDDSSSITECEKVWACDFRWQANPAWSNYPSAHVPKARSSRSFLDLLPVQNCSWNGVCLRSYDATKERVDPDMQPMCAFLTACATQRSEMRHSDWWVRRPR